MTRTMTATAFAHFATISERYARALAQERADLNGAPCGVWQRDGWYTFCEQAPDDIDPDPAALGWTLDAIVEPTGGW